MAMLWPVLPRQVWGFWLADWHRKQGMSGCAFPEGLCTLLV